VLQPRSRRVTVRRYFCPRRPPACCGREMKCRIAATGFAKDDLRRLRAILVPGNHDDSVPSAYGQFRQVHLRLTSRANRKVEISQPAASYSCKIIRLFGRSVLLHCTNSVHPGLTKNRDPKYSVAANARSALSPRPLLFSYLPRYARRLSALWAESADQLSEIMS
jgi:hypothetical protein